MHPLLQFADLSRQSFGIIPVLSLLLLVVLAVAIERALFFGRMVPSGAALERELARLDAMNAEAQAMQVPRLFLLEGELVRAQLVVELEWVRGQLS